MAEKGLRLTHDTTQARDPITVSDFDAARLYLQTQMRIMCQFTPPEQNEKREKYLERVREKVLNAADKPPIIAKLQDERRDFILHKLSDIDANPAHLDAIRNNLVDFSEGKLTAGDGVTKLLSSIDPSQMKSINRALLEERLKADRERKSQLKIT